MAGHAAVTVVFEPELPLLELQALSIARFVRPGDIDEFVVIDNTRDGRVSGMAGQLRAVLGPHPLRIAPADSVARLPASGGWRRQQLLKLFVAQMIESDRYLVLDAKNHFIAPLGRGFLEDASGRARLSAYGFETHPLRPALERTLAYVGLPAEQRMSRYTAAVTPFPFETQVVRSLLGTIGEGSDATFAHRFLDNDLTEFFLYSAWREARGEVLDEVLDLSREQCPVIWPGKTQLDDIRAVVSTAEQPVFGIHRRALSRLTPEAAELVEDFLAKQGLFASSAAARVWLRGAQTAVASERPDRGWRSRAERGLAAARRRWIRSMRPTLTRVAPPGRRGAVPALLCSERVHDGRPDRRD